jgi:hypothetical protein
MEETKIIQKVEKGGNRHWKNNLDKEYLGSHNLEPGEEMLLTIDHFEGEETVLTADGKKTKQVLYFKEDVPKMIMNITNGNVLTQLYGSHPDGWRGKQIQVYVANNVKSFGKLVDALRIRDFAPKRKIDLVGFTMRLEQAKTLEDLKNIWITFPKSALNDPELIKIKDAIKTKLS